MWVVKARSNTWVGLNLFPTGYEPRAFANTADYTGNGVTEAVLVDVNAVSTDRAQVNDVDDRTSINELTFDRRFPPVDVISISGVAGTGRNEIAILGQNTWGNLTLIVKNLLTGDHICSIPIP